MVRRAAKGVIVGVVKHNQPSTILLEPLLHITHNICRTFVDNIWEVKLFCCIVEAALQGSVCIRFHPEDVLKRILVSIAELECDLRLAHSSKPTQYNKG